MIVYADPGTEGAIEIIETECILCPHFGFKPVLSGAKETLYEPSRRRIPRRSVAKAGMEPIAGGLEAV